MVFGVNYADNQEGAEDSEAAMDFAADNAGTPASEVAWSRYLATMDEVRSEWLNSSWAESREERARALFHVMTLMHTGFNSLVSTRHELPFFTLNMFHHPIAFTWGQCCPDFPYKFTFVDGARTYRIWGARGVKRWTEFHLTAEFWGDPNYRTLGIWDIDDFDVAADGSFEIIASPDRHEGNWIELDRNERNTFVLLRDALYDWDNEKPTGVHIEIVGQSIGEATYITEDDLNARLEKVGNFARFSTNHWIQRNNQIADEVGFNKFWTSRDGASGGILHALYLTMLYKIAPDEALVIETDVPKQGIYWGVQLTDLCYQALDSMHHQSSLNGFQTRIDPDGRARLIVSLKDPGIANWIDPVGTTRGVCAWRWVKTDISPIPKVTRVSFSDIRHYLHPQTPSMDPEQRQKIIVARRDAMRRIFNM